MSIWIKHFKGFVKEAYMIQISNKSDCCGCTACKSICPAGAITMVEDFEGFLYPNVNIKSCISCGLCERVCPMDIKNVSKSSDHDSYVIRTKQPYELENSTSGGFITPLFQYILRKNGVFCAASYDEKFSVKHSVFDNISDIDKIRGSKYVQSDLNSCFVEVKDALNKDKLVCFVGTTCQVYGLKSFLQKEYKNLITVDLVCHGVPSPTLWKKYLEFQKKRYKSEIESVSFGNKTYGYHSGTMKIVFTNGKKYYGSACVDLMLKSFFAEISSRPGCYQCPFKILDRTSDFSLYDCWHAKELVKGLKDDDRGYTNLLIHTEKGKQILSKMEESFDVYRVSTDKAVELDGIMIEHSAYPHINRKEFYQELQNDDFEKHIKKYVTISKADKIIEKLKKLIYVIGIYQVVKQVKDYGKR